MKNLDVDGIILYDIQDESDRTSEERTYPFIHTVAPETYYRNYLGSVRQPVIVYKSIANQTSDSFNSWLSNNKDLEHFVFVGASSKAQVDKTNFGLADAYDLKRTHHDHLLLGGVTIPERHSKREMKTKEFLARYKTGAAFLYRSVYIMCLTPRTCCQTIIMMPWRMPMK